MCNRYCYILMCNSHRRVELIVSYKWRRFNRRWDYNDCVIDSCIQNVHSENMKIVGEIYFVFYVSFNASILMDGMQYTTATHIRSVLQLINSKLNSEYCYNLTRIVERWTIIYHDASSPGKLIVLYLYLLFSLMYVLCTVYTHTYG